jgi:hypothetical protein
MSRRLTPRQRRLTAAHEAGHVVIDLLHGMTICENSGSGVRSGVDYMASGRKASGRGFEIKFTDPGFPSV